MHEHCLTLHYAPIAVVAMVLAAILFGWVSLTEIPIQMAPDVGQPVIVVKTNWRGASPTEVEREIVSVKRRSWRALRACGESSSKHNPGVVTLEFDPSQTSTERCC